MAFGATSTTLNGELCSVKWSELLNQIQNKIASVKMQHMLTATYECIVEYAQLEAETKILKTQLEEKTNSCNCTELQKRIVTKDTILEALGSTIIKLNETRNLDVYLPEAYRILSTDSAPLTPPSDPEMIRDANNIRSTEIEQTSVDEDKSIPCKNQNSGLQTENQAAKLHIDQNIKRENTKITSTEQDSELNMNKLNDISKNDESVYEICGTPTGRTSPILGLKILQNRKVSQDLKSFEKSASPRRVAKLSPDVPQKRAGRKGSKLRQTRLGLSLFKPTVTVDLCSPTQLGGGVTSRPKQRTSNPQLDAMRTSTEDDDVIQPSPTSETIRTTFYVKSRASCDVSSPFTPQPAPPPLSAASQDETDLALATGIDFDEPMDTETSQDSVDLLQRASETEPRSPVLHERRVQHDTNASVSVLRRAVAATRSQRENVAPNRDAYYLRAPRSPKKSPMKKCTISDICATHCDMEHSVSLLRNYDVGHDVKAVPEKTSEPEKPVHVYKEEVVRRKADKMKLPGWICQECKNYYGEEDPELMQKMMDRCSRHRGRFNPARASTPPGFWNLHLSVPDDTEALNRLNNVA